MPIHVTVWHEYRHEHTNDKVKAIYPDGMHMAIAGHLRKSPDLAVKTATLDEPSHGLTDELLDNTDVLTWWGHKAHQDVTDEIVNKVHKRVLGGMGFIALHSAHVSKPFVKLMGTTGQLKWRESGDKEILWVVKPGHPILNGVDDHFVIPQEEMYGEYFDVPHPEELLLISSFTHGEVFRSGMTWQRGHGKIFYFRPGHETYPTYHDPNVLRIIENAVRWASPVPGGKVMPGFPNPKQGWV